MYSSNIRVGDFTTSCFRYLLYYGYVRWCTDHPISNGSDGSPLPLRLPLLLHLRSVAHPQQQMPSQSKLLPVPMSSPVGLPTNGLERSVALDPSTDAIQNSSGDARRGQKRARKSQSFTCSWNDCRRVFGNFEHLQRHQRSRKLSQCISGNPLKLDSRCR